jgi:DNA (cytosine-5)-methyltransferase 1
MSLNIFSMFDGVGGFIVGLNDANKSIKKDVFRTAYYNQFEPSRKAQDAYEVGLYRFPEMNHISDDIMTVSDDKFQEMHDAGVNMISTFLKRDFLQDNSLLKKKLSLMGNVQDMPVII